VGREPEISGGIPRIRGDAYGRVKGFFDQCSSFLPGLRKFGVPDAQIVLVEREYICPVRNRVVLFPVAFLRSARTYPSPSAGRRRPGPRADPTHGRRPRTRGKKD